ncbi:MAG: hypothetical protein AB7G06_06025 [Bdellovibrionales bacterium]
MLILGDEELALLSPREAAPPRPFVATHKFVRADKITVTTTVLHMDGYIPSCKDVAEEHTINVWQDAYGEFNVDPATNPLLIENRAEHRQCLCDMYGTDQGTQIDAKENLSAILAAKAREKSFQTRIVDYPNAVIRLERRNPRAGRYPLSDFPSEYDNI